MTAVRRRPALAAALGIATYLAALGLTGSQPASGACVATPDPSGLAATADSYVSGAATGTNYGTSTTLVVNATGPVYTHLQFTVSNSAGATAATLSVYSTSSGTVQTQVYTEPSTWTETGITYANQPTRGALLGKLSTLTAGCYSTLTVPIAGDGTYSFALATSATAARNMTSRETATPPQLLLAAPPSPTPTDSSSPTPPPPSPTPTDSPTTAPPSPTTSPTPADAVVIAGGDVACSPTDASFNNLNGTSTACRSRYTGRIIQSVDPVALLPLGDEQYNSGSPADFAASYDKTWGAVPKLPNAQSLKDISRPAVGNHEYGTKHAGGYFSYFGSAAGVMGAGYYSFDVGSWHLVAINTECTRIDGGVGCAAGSPQETWLRQDLAAHPNACTLVYGHRPRWASNSFAWPDIAPLISDMVDAHVDLYLTGHSHSYERFAPQDASGAASATGLTEITVGTGGSFYTGFGTIAPNSVTHKSNLFGIEKLVLRSGAADFSFLPENSTYTDSGTVTCH